MVLRRCRKIARRLVRGESGQAMVEYALGLTISLYLIMGVVDFGRAFYASNAIANTAREGARYAAVSSHTTSQIISYATSKAVLDNLTVTVVSRGTAGDPSSPAVVQASYTFTPITPLIAQICCGGGSTTMNARSTMYVEY
jgi:Flp pilus assembly protein TadG